MGGDAGLVSPDDSQTFYGSSSALGFTRQLYGSILQKDKIAPELKASEVTSSAQHLPSSSTVANVPPENFSLLPRELSDRLLSLYWDRVHTLYPFLHQDSFNQAYEDLWKPSVDHQPRTRPGLGLGASKDSGPSSIVFHCAFNAALALGMQFSDLPLSERERLSSACLAKSKDLLRFDLFDDGSIALVQTLLLLTQYFQSTNWPSKCWTSIGLACRLAQGLGLHIEESQSNQKFEIGELEMRRRVWHGCVTMDIIVSMTLGRPAMLVGSSACSLPQPVDTCNEVLVVEGDDTLFSIDFFTETVKLYRIVGRILLSIYKIDDDSQERPEHTEDAKKDEIVRDFEHELALFAQKIPTNLMWRSPPEPHRPDPSNDTAAISGFDIGVHDVFVGLRNSLTEDKKIPYLGADAGGELLWSQTNWIAFPSFAGYPSYEIGELKLDNNDMDDSGNTKVGAELTTDFSEDACYAVWIKSFMAAEYKGMIDISLSITDFDAAAKKMSISLVEGPLSNVTRITIVYSKEADGPKRITSWEKAYDSNNFVYRGPQLPSGPETHFALGSGSTCSMLQMPDPQIKSRFWARPETYMDWTMAPSVMIGFHRMKFGLDTPLHLTTGIALRDKKGFAVDVTTWEYSTLFELGMTVVAAE
ncbi:fungal-specific transcription factor domain-containing protein [Boeremia exigua]|uniref:fungal-specific transcription factor domain-containing protein n=1 Tax=Boeremia exigua TaxID=749465 RepID=UPI001E8D984B|nr:fungal-specific transcription factor domain-containing protein [Boeremia exigua]KAH6618877.1 fungal-specific transcription factor domain-containing protein [Boeremia exigua]